MSAETLLNRGLYQKSYTNPGFPRGYMFPTIQPKKYEDEYKKVKVPKQKGKDDPDETPSDTTPDTPPVDPKDDDLHIPPFKWDPPPTLSGTALATQQGKALLRDQFPGRPGGYDYPSGSPMDGYEPPQQPSRTPAGELDWAELAQWEDTPETRSLGRGRNRAPGGALPAGRPQEPFEQPSAPPRTPLGGAQTRASIGRGSQGPYPDSPGVDMGGHIQQGTAGGNALFVPINRGQGAREFGWAGSPSGEGGPTVIQGQSWEMAKAPRVEGVPQRRAIGWDPGVTAVPVYDRPDWIRSERGPQRDPHAFQTREMPVATYDPMEKLRSLGEAAGPGIARGRFRGWRNKRNAPGEFSYEDAQGTGLADRLEQGTGQDRTSLFGVLNNPYVPTNTPKSKRMR